VAEATNGGTNGVAFCLLIEAISAFFDAACLSALCVPGGRLRFSERADLERRADLARAYAVALWLRDQSGLYSWVRSGFASGEYQTNSELGILPCGLHFGVTEATTKIA